MNILIFFVILLMLVLVHEFGHFFTAKKFGIRVDEFGFGFPPKLFGFKKGETEYSFNFLPIGGFVKIFGEDPELEPSAQYGAGPEAEHPSSRAELTTGRGARYGASPDEDRSRSFQYKPKYQQAIVLFAGVLANFLLAWLLFSIGFMSGFPTSVGSGTDYKLQDVNLVVISVVPNSPADVGGLKSGDKIMDLKSGQEILAEINPETLKSFIVSHKDQEIQIGYTRGKGQEINFTKITPMNNLIGIAMDQIGIAKLPLFTAFFEGIKFTTSVTKGTTLGLYTLISEGIQGRGSLESITGPVGIVGMVGDAYQFGFVYLLSFAAFISINLAIINLIPFPALDGGRLFFLLVEKIKGSRINPKIVNTANTIGFGLLILLMLFITYHDVVKLF